MKNRLLPLIFAFLAVASVNAQKCGTYDGYLEKQIQNYPDFYQKLQSQNQKLAADNQKALKSISAYKTEDGKKIIPVVVHNIYNGSSGYLSDAVIQAAIDALNKNINGQSDKFLNQSGNYPLTPDIFAAVRGVANVEFRLAKITPTCDTCIPKSTTGIIRINTEITSLGSSVPDPVKALTYWNSYQYLNIWTVPSFGGEAGGGLLGYAQFPYRGMMSTDGVVLKANEMGSAVSSTLTHEVGHWLGLFHTWGDAVCGDDGIYDTPPARYDNNGASESSPTPSGHPLGSPSTFPYHVGLSGLGQVPPVSGVWGCVADSLNPAGEMFMNYMSYTTDEYTTMFSAGQIEAVNVTLEGEVDEESGVSDFGYREYMWSSENNIATGTNDGYFNLDDNCSAKYDFYDRNDRAVCLGLENWFNSNSKAIGFDVTAASWDFGDGIVDTSDYLVSLGYYKKHTYANAGKYNVTLMIDYNELREVRVSDTNNLDPSYDSLFVISDSLIVQGTKNELVEQGALDIAVHIDLDGYSKNSYWIRDQESTDSILQAYSIDTLYYDSIMNVSIYVDSTFLSSTEEQLLDIADSSWIEDVLQGTIDTFDLTYAQFNDTTIISFLTYEDSTYLSSSDSINIFVDADSSWNAFNDFEIDSLSIYYGQYYDTTIISFITYIDSTSLSPSDSVISYLTYIDSTFLSPLDSVTLFTDSDTSWYFDGLLNASDSIRVYYAQFNDNSTIIFADADTSWSVDGILNTSDSIRIYYAQFNHDSIFEILTIPFSDSLTATDSMLLNDNISGFLDDGFAFDSVWHYLKINISDSIRVYYAQFNHDSIVEFSNIINSTLTESDSLVFNNADSTWSSLNIVGHFDTMLTYYLQFSDSTVISFLTYIDSTFLLPSDSVILFTDSDTSWYFDGLLNSSDSVRIYYAQFNHDSTIEISTYIDTGLTLTDSLLLNSADTSWYVSNIIGRVDTLRTYFGYYSYNRYDGYFADTLFYRGKLENTTYIAYYKSSCKDTIVKVNYITIGEEQATNIAFPYAYSFENENAWYEDWSVNQPQSIDNEWEFQSSVNTLWEWTSKASNSGSASIMIDKDNLSFGSTEIISPAYNLNDLSVPAIKFSWSGAASTATPSNLLQAYYSSNCGKTWYPLVAIDPINSANAGMYLSDFSPNASQWMDTVVTKNQLKDDNIMFKFEYFINGNSNNFYLDNIMIGEESELMMVGNTTASRVSIYPNPTDGKTFIKLNNLKNIDVEVKLVNILGAEIMHLFSGEIVSNYYMINNIDLSHLETGIYFVKVVADGDIVMTDKLILK